MTAEVLKFPHRRSHVIKSLLETAKRLEDSSPETCIAIQGQVIAMMSEEVAQSRRTAYAALRAMSAMSFETSIQARIEQVFTSSPQLTHSNQCIRV